MSSLPGYGEWRGAERDGAWSFFYPEGQLMARGAFQDGRKSGPWRYWSPDGSVLAEGTYEGGQPDGAWILYEEDGSVCACRSELVCEGNKIFNTVAGSDHFPWRAFSSDQQDELSSILPYYSTFPWTGSGFYVDGSSQELLDELARWKASMAAVPEEGRQPAEREPDSD